MEREIELHQFGTCLVVKIPEKEDYRRGVWEFVLRRANRGDLVLAKYARSKFQQTPRAWSSDLSLYLRIQLQDHIPSKWLQDNWRILVFGYIEKMINHLEHSSEG